MGESGAEIVERVPDEGQRFHRGERVDFFPRAGGHLPPALERAALGAYEVVDCLPVHERGRRWLDVRLRGAFRTMRPPRRRVAT